MSDVLFTFLENIHKEDHNLHFPRNKTNKRHANRTKLQRQQECRIVISFIMNCKTLYLPVQIEFLEQWNVHKIGRRTITFYGRKYCNPSRIGIVNSRWINENLMRAEKRISGEMTPHYMRKLSKMLNRILTISDAGKLINEMFCGFS